MFKRGLKVSFGRLFDDLVRAHRGESPDRQGWGFYPLKTRTEPHLPERDFSHPRFGSIDCTQNRWGIPSF